MRHRSPGHRLGSGGLIVIVWAAVVACAAEPVSPLPFDPAGTPGPSAATSDASAFSSPTAAGSSSPSTRGPRNPGATVGGPPRSRSPDASPACLGAVVYTLAADTELALVRSLCLGVGAILRVEGTGPGTVSADRPELVAQAYEAGVVECRFLRTGTVVISIERDEQVFPIPVVVK